MLSLQKMSVISCTRNHAWHMLKFHSFFGFCLSSIIGLVRYAAIMAPCAAHPPPPITHIMLSGTIISNAM